jgi:hypothetical protein
MSVDESRPHSKQVDDWIKQNAGGLPAEKLVVIFGEAILAIQKRAGMTLSEVTLSAIFDRVLYTSQQKFTLLSKVKIESKGIVLDALLDQAIDLERDEITGAFRFFLIELLTLLGNLTADILTKPLYRELFKVTAKSVHASPKHGHRGLRSVKGSSDREDV